MARVDKTPDAPKWQEGVKPTKKSKKRLKGRRVSIGSGDTKIYTQKFKKIQQDSTLDRVEKMYSLKQQIKEIDKKKDPNLTEIKKLFQDELKMERAIHDDPVLQTQELINQNPEFEVAEEHLNVIKSNIKELKGKAWENEGKPQERELKKQLSRYQTAEKLITDYLKS